MKRGMGLSGLCVLYMYSRVRMHVLYFLILNPGVPFSSRFRTWICLLETLDYKLADN